MRNGRTGSIRCHGPDVREILPKEMILCQAVVIKMKIFNYYCGLSNKENKKNQCNKAYNFDYVTLSLNST